ncbi:uncharacterized protein TNCV_3723231 [Trichonephila clavipes]|nr:uncharacterized protein TNCV_3723231 [Trichonephila clavipes]
MRHKKRRKRVKDNKYLNEYQEVFREWENLNIIEKVPEWELNYKGHFLPHGPVIKMSSQTTKIRPVFDASSREKGSVSLNQCIFTGPNLLELIPNIIDKFRLYPIGLNADIEKAFLQLEIAPKDVIYVSFILVMKEK